MHATKTTIHSLIFLWKTEKGRHISCAVTVLCTPEQRSQSKKGHQRQPFTTFIRVSITKATCYALQMNHNKEEAEGRDPPVCKWMLSA